MKNKLDFLIYFGLIIIVLDGCDHQTSTIKESAVSVICLAQGDSLLDVKISNNSKEDIYIPENYLGLYTENEDTVHLESFENPKFFKSKIFLYKHIMPFEFYLTEEIKNVTADSVFEITDAVLVNQFRVQPFSRIPKGESHFAEVRFHIPRRGRVVKAEYFKMEFRNAKDLREVNYTESDFIKFDSLNGYYVIAPIYLKY